MPDNRARTKGKSLAKGPAYLIGLAALAFGILGMLFGSTDFTSDPMSGTVNGETWLGIEGNGWTWLSFIAGGLLLVIAAPLHWGAKTMALIVGLAFGAASVIALVDGDDVFGVGAANGLTKLIWGAAAVALLVIALLPRVGKKQQTDDTIDASRERTRGGSRTETVGRAHQPDGQVDERTAVASSRRQDAHGVESVPPSAELHDRADRVERTGRFERDADASETPAAVTAGSSDADAARGADATGGRPFVAPSDDERTSRGRS